ncbi:endolytic transglycosylase MltG [Thalassobacillus pellis]|uniref:endolytic transglycosylase MltG n=1 Tax=Thalassobacillus pellis TaxID=748008 RepID=UPI00195F3F0B|nr:endolytic transglycosylase MltG [Thalassobacillus pellis]MBM7554673.1 UPF0755 protein [Thalassobacillus pellis]
MSGSNFEDQYRKRLKKRGEEASIVRKVVAIVLTALLVIIVGGGIAGYLYVKSALQPVDPSSEEEVSVEVPLGSSTSHIANILEEKGIIKDATIFRFYTKFKNETGFQAGEYEFTPSMTIEEVINTLKSGKVMRESLFSVTIPEGKTLEQIATIFASEENTNFTKKEFLKKANDPKYVKSLMDKYPRLLTDAILGEKIRYPLEGYLYASTYQYYKENPSIDKIINQMLEKTVEVVLPYKDQLENVPLDSIHDAITMASLLENEARSAEQRKKIAGVFYNRMAKEMPLQTDPTVLYALGEHKDRVLYEDLEVESPYNTYHVTGLPVGPISNFNENSLKAALNPTESDYLYFVADSEGNIYYSKTHEKHLQLKKEHIGNQSS